MLHVTAAQGKSNRYKAYMGYRELHSPVVHAEDEVTSTVLGPLDFLSSKAVFTFWRTVFSVAGYNHILPCDPPNKSKVVFWDARPARQGGLRIEPDGRIDLFWDNQRQPRHQTLLIEVKWRAPLSGDDQLHRQWCDYLTDEERAITHHVFIGITTAEGLAAKHSQLGNVWQGRLILISWLQIRAAFSELMHRDDELGRWSKLADRFLEKVGIRRFLGFSRFQYENCAITSFIEPVFWSQFSTWKWAFRFEVAPVTVVGNIFWLD